VLAGGGNLQGSVNDVLDVVDDLSLTLHPGVVDWLGHALANASPAIGRVEDKGYRPTQQELQCRTERGIIHSGNLIRGVLECTTG
jgi:hypothetical protein